MGAQQFRAVHFTDARFIAFTLENTALVPTLKPFVDGRTLTGSFQIERQRASGLVRCDRRRFVSAHRIVESVILI